MRRGLATATAVLAVALATLGTASSAAPSPAVVLLAYNNDIDGVIAATAAEYEDNYAQAVVIPVDTRTLHDRLVPLEVVYNRQVGGFATDCIVVVGSDPNDQASQWAQASPTSSPEVVSAQGLDRYATAESIKHAVLDCAQ